MRHVVIRTALEPDDRAAVGQIATVFSLWQQSGADVGELAPPGAGWVQPGTGGAVSVYATDSSLLLANVEF
ncbi:hypothetical protein GCM10009716_02160 [Streptomyces sodiiphilus]|uniref:GNAT family N-acetyltransferase n=1 Tax=Streptomyces sodiiphilus TaxID=226217 RepID=A0ABP5A1H6_9ACTN